MAVTVADVRRVLGIRQRKHAKAILRIVSENRDDWDYDSMVDQCKELGIISKRTKAVDVAFLAKVDNLLIEDGKRVAKNVVEAIPIPIPKRELDLAAEVARLKRENTELTERRQGRIHDMAQEMAGQQKMIGQLKSEIAEMSNCNNDLRLQIKGLLRENEESQVRIKELSNDGSLYEKQRKELNTKLNRSIEENGRLKKETEDQRERIVDLSNQLDEQCRMLKVAAVARNQLQSQVAGESVKKRLKEAELERDAALAEEKRLRQENMELIAKYGNTKREAPDEGQRDMLKVRDRMKELESNAKLDFEANQALRRHIASLGRMLGELSGR